ncbi:MAG TPA: hypothetical protein VGH28_17885 [Polyangiaceae bacterium]
MRFVWLLTIAACVPHPPAAQPAPRVDRWAALDFEQRHAVMTFTVLPNMARTWRDFRHTEYPEMTCRTCHGKDAEAVSYRMPNPSLPAVDPEHPPTGPVAEFMKTKMLPDMIDLTGASPEHFSCNTCHPK